MAASISFQADFQESGSDGTLGPMTVASAAGQERLLCFCAIVDDQTTATIGSVAIDGASATQIGSTVTCADTGANGAILSFWRAAGTSNTSVIVTYTASGGSFFDSRGVIWSLNDVGTLFDSTVTIATSTPVVLDVDTISNGVTAAAMLAYNSATHASSWTGLTECMDGLTIYGTDWVTAANLNITSGSTPLAITATLPGDYSAGAVVAMAVSFNPVGAVVAESMVLGPIWT